MLTQRTIQTRAAAFSPGITWKYSPAAMSLRSNTLAVCSSADKDRNSHGLFLTRACKLVRSACSPKATFKPKSMWVAVGPTSGSSAKCSKHAAVCYRQRNGRFPWAS